MLSLPAATGITGFNEIPDPSGYLESDDELARVWSDKLSDRAARKRVAICWAGGKDNPRDPVRSIKLQDFESLLSVPGCEFHVVQKERDPSDTVRLQSHPDVIDQGDALEDFEATAAILEHMDVVVTVDTAVAHLAAAMGKPTWILLDSVPDWRWMVEREDSPWYASVKLFRQQVAGDWRAVMEKVKAELTVFASSG